MYFALVNANSFFDSAKKIKCILYLALCSVKFDECAHLYHFLIKFGQADVKLFPPKKKKKKSENTLLIFAVISLTESAYMVKGLYSYHT